MRYSIVRLYALLAAVFTALLVVCNLIANKFIALDFGVLSEPLVLSCGVLAYPITFVITDLLSEFFGKKLTTHVVVVGFISSILVLGLLRLCTSIPAWEGSPVNDIVFASMFGNSRDVIFASMSAYLVAQLVDVKLYDFWKKVSKGKYLWLRNNGSTIISQLVDTTLVVLVLFWGTDKQDEITTMIRDGWSFKFVVALVDTLVIYALVHLIRKAFKLEKGEEFSFKKN